MGKRRSLESFMFNSFIATANSLFPDLSASSPSNSRSRATGCLVILPLPWFQGDDRRGASPKFQVLQSSTPQDPCVLANDYARR